MRDRIKTLRSRAGYRPLKRREGDYMTLQATTWAWQQTGLSPAEKLVLLALSDSSSDHAPPPDPGSIAAQCELDTEELHEILTSLESDGLIEADYRTVTR